MPCGVLTAGDIAKDVRKAFPDASIEYEPDPVRAKIVGSWPEDVDDARAQRDWGWHASYDWERAFEDYLVPSIKARYAQDR